jgi:hypothetical protein
MLDVTVLSNGKILMLGKTFFLKKVPNLGGKNNKKIDYVRIFSKNTIFGRP